MINRILLCTTVMGSLAACLAPRTSPVDAGIEPKQCSSTASRWTYRYQMASDVPVADFTETRDFPSACSGERTCDCLLAHGKNNEDPCVLWRCEADSQCQLTLTCAGGYAESPNAVCQDVGSAGMCGSVSCAPGCRCFAYRDWQKNDPTQATPVCDCSDTYGCEAQPNCGAISCENNCKCVDANAGVCACDLSY